MDEECEECEELIGNDDVAGDVVNTDQWSMDGG